MIVMGDDQIGLHIAHHGGEARDQRIVLGGDVQIVRVHGVMGRADDLGGVFRFLKANLAQLIGHDFHMSQIAVRYVANRYVVSLLDVLGECAVASDFQIVRMTSNGQNLHVCFLLFYASI